MEIPEPHPFSAVVRLPRDDQAARPRAVTAHGALHWAPHHDAGFSARMGQLAAWVRDARPEAVVVDVSVEVAAFVRLLGVPVVVMALPGHRVDAPHLLVHRLADHIIAAWPRALCAPSWLRPWDAKTSYVGGISRFEDRTAAGPTSRATPLNETRVLVFGGSGDASGTALGDCAAAQSVLSWTTIGGSGGTWKDDPWSEIRAADVVVTHAGQSCVADVAAAQRPAVVIPQPRPFDEQRTTARVLNTHRLAVVSPTPPGPRSWPALLTRATATDPRRWRQWEVQGAAGRAADAIESTARRCRQGV